MKDDRLYLLHIRDALAQIASYTASGRAAFFADRKTQDAVVRNLEIVGEAVKRLSPELRQDHDDIPWKRISGMRDRLIHGYFGIDWGLVWQVVEKESRPLAERVDMILRDRGSAD